jgi:hypothetical protein
MNQVDEAIKYLRDKAAQDNAKDAAELLRKIQEKRK